MITPMKIYYMDLLNLNSNKERLLVTIISQGG